MTWELGFILHSSPYVLHYCDQSWALPFGIWMYFVSSFRNYTESMVVLCVDVPLERSEINFNVLITAGSSFVSLVFFLSHDLLSNACFLLILLYVDQPLTMAFLMDFICSISDLRRKEVRISSRVLSKHHVCWALRQCWVSRPNQHRLGDVCARIAIRDGSESCFVIIHCCYDWLCNRAPVEIFSLCIYIFIPSVSK